MSRHVWTWAATSVVLGAGYLLIDDPLLRETLWIVTLAGVCVGMVLGVRLHRPSRVHPFVILLTAFALLTVGYLLRFPAWTTPTSELVGDLSQLIAYPLITVAVLALVRLQASGGDREGAIDGTIVMIAMATLLAGTVFDASQLDSDAGLLPRLLMVVAPLLLSAVAAASFRLLFVGSVRVPSAWLLVGAAVGALVGNVARTVMMAQGSYQRGTWVDLFLLASYVFVALGLLHPSIATLTEPSEPGSRKLTHARLVVLSLALLAAPATLVIQQPGIGISMPILSSVVLSLLVLWRLTRLVVEREIVRHALHGRAARQEALAEIGRQALEDPELEALCDEVARCCQRLLVLDTCAVMGSGIPTAPGAVAIPVDERAGALVAVRGQPWSDEDLAFLRSAANVLTGAFRRHDDQETMRHQAVHDALTGLPNRVLIIDRIQHGLARARRTDGTVTVLFLDLDGFKQVNDAYGHQAGDDLLVEVAHRLREHVREADTVGRLAGDEFVVVRDTGDHEADREVAGRIARALSEPFELACGPVRIGASIGLATSTRTVGDAERLLGEADMAMYEAKEQLGSAVVAFDQHVGEARERQRGLELDLAGAIDRNELRLVYQPLVAARPEGGDHVIGVEALLRWDHPVHGTVPPLEFIPLADATGLILPVGDWVIEHAVEQLAVWTAPLPADVPFTVWVNLSPRQLGDRRLPERVARMLRAADVPPWRLGCEVTENAVLREDAIPVVAGLRALGIQLALDDFGTGFSSLTHLKQLALDLIKIDRSFVGGVTEPGGDRAIVRAVTAIARELGVDVVGEGVETSGQLQALRDLGCDLAQGYHLGRPVPPNEIVPPLPAVVSR